METTDKSVRNNWKVGSLLQVFVPSRNKWYDADITKIFIDIDGEWLIVSIQNKILFELNRFDSHLRRHKTKQEIEQEMKDQQRNQREMEEKQEAERIEKEKKKLDSILRGKSQFNQIISKDFDTKSYSSGDDLDTDYYTESNESSISNHSDHDSLESIHSDHELYAKFEDLDEKDEDPALIVITIQRAGTLCANGKYLYNGQQRGKPLWQKENDQKGKLWWKYDSIWTLEYDNNDLYIAYTVRVLPPSSGWEAVDHGKYPVPSVVLHRLNQMETIKNYLTGSGANQNVFDNDDDGSFSPLKMMEYDFEIINNYKTKSIEQQFGFTLELKDTTGLMYVNNVIENSQANQMGMQIGDIISNVEENDISLLGDVNKMYQYLKDQMSKLKSIENNYITMTFGRNKSTFPIVLLSRSGTSILNGKYSIKGRINGAWRFVQNKDPKYEIHRIYYDSDEDESIWVIRTETKNAIESAKEEEQRLLSQEQNEEENKRRQEEQERIKQQQLEQERKQKIVDEQWLFPLFKKNQLSNITGSNESSKCKKQKFVEYFVSKKKINIEIVNIIWESIDSKQRGVITAKQYFAFKTNFTIEKMRKLLPEFCPTPEHILDSQQETANRKQLQEQKEVDSKKKRVVKETKPLLPQNNSLLPLSDPKTVEELKQCGFNVLKDLCKKQNLPPNGNKRQLFIKLKQRLFTEEKEIPEPINVVISTKNDQKKRKKIKNKTPKPISPSPVVNISRSPIPMSYCSTPFTPITPMSVEIHDDVEHKEDILVAVPDSSDETVLDYSSLDEYSDSSEQPLPAETFKDYYCGLGKRHDLVPPNYGWEAIEPNGEWPAPGLNVYDIELTKQNLQTPIIEKVVPSPGCATIYFSCDEPRVPQACKHMDYWFEIESIGHKQVIKCIKSPAVFTNLINGNNYQFIVKCCSILSTKYSEKSEIVTPLLLPSKPYFTNIEGKPRELFLYWACTNFDVNSTNCTVTLITTPMVPPPKGYQVNDSGEIILNSNKNINPDSKNMIHLTSLKTGREYKIQLRATNAVGTMESAIEIASANYPPPQPMIRQVISGNREIIIDVHCHGWNQIEQKCWFEVDVSPKQPTLEFLQQEIYASARAIKKKHKKQHETNKSSMATINRLASARSKSTFSTVLSKIDLSPFAQYHESKQHISFVEEDENYIDENDEIPMYKHKKRYYSLPIIISPLVNGEEYIVTIKAKNYTGIKSSKPSNFCTPIGIPPKPIIKSVYSRDCAVKIIFECDDYSTSEYRAVYEVISIPKTNKIKTRRFNMKFKNLENGIDYKFKIRGINSIGKGEWSDESELIKPLKLPPNIQELRMVPGNEEISLYWVANDINHKKYSGWYEITTKPITKTIITRRQQCIVKGLTNNLGYKFNIYAVNTIGRSSKFESALIKPKADVQINYYNYLKSKTLKKINQLRQDYYKQIGEKYTIENKNIPFEDVKPKNKKKNKRKKKKKAKKKHKKQGAFALNAFASMVKKQHNKENTNKENKNKENKNNKHQKVKNEMNKAKNALYAKKRHASIMDVNRIDNFSQKFKNIVKK